MNTLLIDTDILIDIANSDTIAQTTIQTASQTYQLGVSVITVMELMVGCRNKTELQSLNQFLNQFTQKNLNTTISSKAVELIKTYRLSHNLLIPDALIAATAITEKIPLLSKN